MEASSEGSAWGVVVPPFGASNGAGKIFEMGGALAIDGCRLIILNATTNQKQAAALTGSMTGGWDKREARGKQNTIVSGGVRVEWR